MVHFTASILMMLMLVDQIFAGFYCNVPSGKRVVRCDESGITLLKGITGDVTNVQIL